MMCVAHPRLMVHTALPDALPMRQGPGHGSPGEPGARKLAQKAYLYPNAELYRHNNLENPPP